MAASRWASVIVFQLVGILRKISFDPEWLRVGDTVDFYRVERCETDRLLSLFAELKLPGRAWLQFEVEPCGEGSLIRQTAIFDPMGVWGLGTWYLLYPFHKIIFVGMLRGIARAIESQPA